MIGLGLSSTEQYHSYSNNQVQQRSTISPLSTKRTTTVVYGTAQVAFAVERYGRPMGDDVTSGQKAH